MGRRSTLGPHQMTNYELFWLRELLGGVLGGEYGGKGKSLADLPINETLAGRIHRLSVPGPPSTYTCPTSVIAIGRFGRRCNSGCL